MKPSMSPRFQASACSLSNARKSFSTCESCGAAGEFNPVSRVLAAIPVADTTMTMPKQVRSTLLVAIHIGHLLFSHAARRIDDIEPADKYEPQISRILTISFIMCILRVIECPICLFLKHHWP